MEVTVYRITGRQGYLTVPDWVCRECDLTVAAVRRACSEAGVPEGSVKVVPWLKQLRAALGEGAYHPPVVLVGGRVFSQGRVPDVAELAEHLRQGLASERANG